MNGEKRPDLKVIEQAAPKTAKKTVQGHSNPILKKLAVYINEDLDKFTVKDLFKK